MEQAMMALAYLFVFLPIVVMVVGHELGFQWGSLILFFVILPVLRTVTGDLDKEPPLWTEFWSKFLAALPLGYSGVFVLFFLWVIVELGAGRPASTLDRVGFVSGLLLTFALASCVAHELVHRKKVWHRRMGHLLTALGGYPFFGYEHIAHHASPRDHEKAHCPRVDESIWSFAFRRSIAAPFEAVSWAAAARARSVNPSVFDSIWFWTAVSASSLVTMTMVGGLYGAATFATLAIALPLLMNMMVYLQHWGLGTDNGVDESPREQFGWEDSCRSQAWLTLNIAMHSQHHQRPGAPYYRIGAGGGGPVAPSGYALMLLIAFFPPLWYRLMMPRLQGWINNPQGQEGAGKRLYCLRINTAAEPPAG